MKPDAEARKKLKADGYDEQARKDVSSENGIKNGGSALACLFINYSN